MRVVLCILLFVVAICSSAHADEYTVLCPTDYYIVDEHCVACPSGYTNPAGSNTECTRRCPDGKLWVWYGDCLDCPAGYPHSDADAANSDYCYSDPKFREWDGTAECRTIPDNCTSASCTIDGCPTTPEPCEYVEYSNGKLKSGCDTNPCLSDIFVTYDLNLTTIADVWAGGNLAYNPESGICEPCRAGTYQAYKFIAPKCKQCNAGTYNPNSGATDSNACIACPAGTYSDAGAAACEPCPAGTYSNTTGAAECTPCEPSTFNNNIGSMYCYSCSTGTTSASGATECTNIICDDGYYKNGNNCIKCPDEYPNSHNATDIKQCYSDTKTRECAPSTGCESVIYDMNTLPNTCEYVEYYTEIPWLSDIKSGCKNCDIPILLVTALPGYYINGDKCERCPEGTYSHGGNITECVACTDDNTECIQRKCPDGRFYIESWYDCLDCPDGYPHSDPDATSIDQCYSDPKFREWDGTVKCDTMPDGCTSATCTVCDAEPEPCEYIEYADGTVKSGCAANPCLSDVIDSAVGPAYSGLVLNKESGKCELCPPGTMYTRPSQWEDFYCAPCVAGSYNPDSGATSCQKCPAGTYSNAPGAASCTPCEPNTFASFFGFQSCEQCPEGQYSEAGASYCTNIPCDDGYYGGGLNCTKCPDEYPNSDVGATQTSDCYSNTKIREWTGEQIIPNLPDGCADATYGECQIDACEYVVYEQFFPWDTEPSDGTIKSGCSSNSANCTKPILSVTANPGYIVNGTACDVCPAGTYSPGGNATECIQCPKNTYSATGATECTPCPDEYPNADAGSTAITECYSNEKERAWTGRQVCTTPTNCTAAVCTPCEIKPCKYVVYAQQYPWDPTLFDGAIKSGCETNNANCSTPVQSLVAAPGWGTIGTSQCEACDAGTYSVGGKNAQCTLCPANTHVSQPGATSADECGRILKYQSANATTPVEIFINKIRNTAPSLNIQIGNDILYADMTPVNDTTSPGMYIAYNGQTYIVGKHNNNDTGFSILFVPADESTFSITLTAAGTFQIDWGDGTVDDIERSATTTQTYSHTYTAVQEYTITLTGTATAYSTTESVMTFSVSALPWWEAITYSISISGSLGSVFSTIGNGGIGNQPLFKNTFGNNTNLTGDIPAELFYGITGLPAPQMFMTTFIGCSNLTGQSPRMSDGTPLYEWAASIPDACPDQPQFPWDPNGCSTFNGATGLSDYDEIPDMFK